MIWAVVIIGGILIFAGISSMSKKTEETQEKTELNELSKSRVDAYQDYLRRTSDNEEIKAMTENELKDYIFSAMREYNKNLNELTPFNAPKYAEIRFLPTVLLWSIFSAGALTAMIYEDVSAPIWLTVVLSAIVGMVLGLFVWGVSKILPISGSKWGHDQYEKSIQELVAKIKEKGLDPERLIVEK